MRNRNFPAAIFRGSGEGAQVVGPVTGYDGLPDVVSFANDWEDFATETWWDSVPDGVWVAPSVLDALLRARGFGTVLMR